MNRFLGILFPLLAVVVTLGVGVGLAVNLPAMQAEARAARQALYDSGHEAGALGLSPESCPYAQTWNQEDRRTLWMEGYIDGARAKAKAGK